MKKAGKVIIIAVIVILVLLIFNFIIASNNKEQEKSTNSVQEFLLDTNYKYIVRTDAIVYTYLDDGGTHYDIYYEIDLEEKTIEKREDYICASISASVEEQETQSYTRKLLANGNLSDDQVDQLKKMFDDRISKGNAVTTEISVSTESYKTCYISSQYAEDIKMSEEEIDEFLEIISSSIEE